MKARLASFAGASRYGTIHRQYKATLLRQINHIRGADTRALKMSRNNKQIFWIKGRNLHHIRSILKIDKG
jgi:hypothetical protein